MHYHFNIGGATGAANGAFTSGKLLDDRADEEGHFHYRAF